MTSSSAAEPVEKCKRVLHVDRVRDPQLGLDINGRVDADDLWRAFDSLLAENARLASEVRAGEEKDTEIARLKAMLNGLTGGTYSKLERIESSYGEARKSLGAEDSARASGARGGAE